MRNLKRALSLGLTAAMISGLMVMGSSAASYADVTSEDNVEAIEVLQAAKIMVGDENGNFNPDQNVTRNEMAVIMANLMAYNVASYKDTSPFTDVPSWAADYVAACYTNGITSGYSATTYGGSDTVTTAQAALMLMKALGYFQYQSDFGGDWQLATTRQGNAIDLFVGVDTAVTAPMTRNDVAQLVLNALKAGTVTASTDGSWTIGDVTLTNNVKYNYVTSNQAYASAIDDRRTTNNDGDLVSGSIVELGEKLYMGDLKLNDDTTDVFGRPARYWEYDGNEIGTYAKTELLRQEYTTKVTGEDLYDLLGKSVIDDYSFDIYVDGESDSGILGSAYFDKDYMIRTNDDAVGGTGNGVLTQVYQDIDKHEITIAIINTYLAQAEEDYDEKNEDLDLTIYNINEVSKTFVKADNESESMTITSDDYDIADVAEDDLFLVTVADGEIQSMVSPEILSETVVSNFKRTSYVTADGTQYDYADTAMYDEEVLDQYDNNNMKDVTYNVILDQYGYLIGIELNQDPDQYVFVTGVDSGRSNLASKNADVNVIFLDGTMDTVTVDIKDSTIDLNNNGHNAQLNTWCKYTVDSNGVYTLDEIASKTDSTVKPAVKVAQHAQNVTSGTVNINEKNVSLDGTPGNFNKVYGNDETVYLNVDLEANILDRGNAPVRIIDDVESVTVGVKNVDIEVTNATNVVENGTTYTAPTNEIYTLYNKDGYIIAVVTIGENNGISSNYAYIISDEVNREAYNGNSKARAAGDSDWTWTREAVVNGEIVELTEVGSTLKILDELEQGKWYEVKYDADGNVRRVDAANMVDNDHNGLYDGIQYAAGTKFVDKVADVPAAINDFDTVLMADTTTVDKLTYKNGTLYTSTTDDRGFSVSPDVKVVLAVAGKNGDGKGADWFDEVSDGYTGYAGLEKALRDMNADASGFGIKTVQVSAILGNSGSATVIVINDLNPKDGAVVPGTPTSDYTPVVTQRGTFLDVQANTIDGESEDVYVGAWNWLVKNGYSVMNVTSDGSSWTFIATKGGNTTFFKTNLIPMVHLNINGVDQYVRSDGTLTYADVLDGPYYATSSSKITTVGLTTATGLSTKTASTWNTTNFNANNNLYIKDNLYKVTVDSDGSGSDSNTDYYYQIGESIDAQLKGNWYNVNAVVSDGNATSTTGVKMTSDLANDTIYDNYYKVTSSAVDPAVTEYVIGGQTSSAVGDQYRYAKDSDGTYVALDGSGKLANVTRDYNIVDSGYVLINENVTVTDTGVTGLNGMQVRATVAPNTYVKENGSFDVQLELLANGKVANGDVKISKAEVKGSGAASTATVTGDPVTIVKDGANTQEVNEVTLTVASFNNGVVTVTLTLADET